MLRIIFFLCGTFDYPASRVRGVLNSVALWLWHLCSRWLLMLSTNLEISHPSIGRLWSVTFYGSGFEHTHIHTLTLQRSQRRDFWCRISVIASNKRSGSRTAVHKLTWGSGSPPSVHELFWQLERTSAEHLHDDGWLHISHHSQSRLFTWHNDAVLMLHLCASGCVWKRINESAFTTPPHPYPTLCLTDREQQSVCELATSSDCLQRSSPSSFGRYTIVTAQYEPVLCVILTSSPS